MKKPSITPETKNKPIFSENEELTLRRAIIHYGTEGPSKEETEHVRVWAHHTAVKNALLELVLEGKLAIRIREDGELVFCIIPNIRGN